AAPAAAAVTASATTIAACRGRAEDLLLDHVIHTDIDLLFNGMRHADAAHHGALFRHVFASRDVHGPCFHLRHADGVFDNALALLFNHLAATSATTAAASRRFGLHRLADGVVFRALALFRNHFAV